MKTWLDLKTEIRGLCYPAGEAENLMTRVVDGETLIGAHDVMLEEGACDIQKWVPCERNNNTNTFPFCSTWFSCGLTVVAQPAGIIDRVYSIANGEWCDAVFYRERTWPEPEKLARNMDLARQWVSPDQTGLPVLPQGFKYADASSDSSFGRARSGIWAKYRNKIWVFPWLQSNETLVIEWRGLKKTYADTDIVNDEILYRTALRAFLAYAHERDFGDLKTAADLKAVYDSALADLMHECNERMRRRTELDYDDTRNRFTTEIQDDAVPSPAGITFAMIGQYGFNSSGEKNVGDLVRSWQPNFIATTGGNLLSGTDYDAAVGQYYHDWIYPYIGQYGDGAAINLFWPTTSKGDWDQNNLIDYQAFFRLPADYAERFYDLVRGDVHLFFLDSDAREPEGNGPGSSQKAWLASKVSLSTAVWKVAVLYDNPFSSAASGGSTASAQWDFKGMGLDLVISGGSANYERLSVDDLPYIVNGLGGAPIDDFLGVPVTGSVTRYNDEYGALKVFATSATLKTEFWDRYGFIVDTLELTK